MSKFEDQMDKAGKELEIHMKKAKQAWDENVQPGINQAYKKVKPGMEKAGEKIGEAADAIGDSFEEVIDKAKGNSKVQNAKEKAGHAADYVGDKADVAYEKVRPHMEKISDSIEKIVEDMQPYVDRTKARIGDFAEAAAYKSATSGIREEYQSFSKGIYARCSDLKEEIGKSELSEETKVVLTDKLDSIINGFEMSAYNILKSKNKPADLEDARIHYFGKNCELSALLRSIGQYQAEDRKGVGQVINKTRGELEAIYEDVKVLVDSEQQASALDKEKLDVTLPGKDFSIGTVHPITLIFEEMCEIFIGMGFSVKDGPEVELDKYNFDMLNLPKDHPARDMQDTFYIEEGEVVLRTHTSPVQIRTMLKEKPPIRILAPGRVYRSDDIDATHSPIFHQMEGLVIDKDVSMAHLKGILDTFANKFFGEDIKVRLRPSFFPFTEPSAEVDFTCVACKGKGCSVCKQTGWIEVLGCGMVHPNVLRNCGIDPEEYSGLAFGMGLDRIANLKFKSSDIRLLYENDVRFLEQF